ncbi:MAG: DUF3014 domain-containing protein [Gammaproteobacteria bacterium]|nr:DUF3014 domain-containing protein [Gammaproteobacteria bacterium]MDP2142122.1 DUF3014 domain-containing protein [Gammaproteobacteria bacterium]MDP2348270.1 DUF3014 domain-containing protein [Gammaproteobacteria bacterium]
MANKSMAIIAAIAVIGLLFLVYLAATFETPDGTRTVELEQPVPRPAEPVQRVVEPAPVLPTVTEPLPVERPQVVEVPTPAVVEEVVELPTLNMSDAFVLARLGALETGATLMNIVASEELIRKFVVFVDNVAGGNLPQLEYPVDRLPQAMAIRELDQNLFEMQTVSYQRYNPVVDALVAVNPDQAIAIYRILRPLFQEAYAEIGYPNRNFDDTVVRAINEVTSARTAEGPFQLIRPKEMYVYANSDIESMSPVEKQLLRMGPQNAEKLKAALAQYGERLNAAR